MNVRQRGCESSELELQDGLEGDTTVCVIEFIVPGRDK